MADGSTRGAAELQLEQAAMLLSGFLGGGGFTSEIAALEDEAEHASAADLERLTAAAHIDGDLLRAAVVIRQAFGRVNDVIHAVGIVLCLPRLLGDGEYLVNRPSLAAGNDPTRQFDVETNLRVCEFKFSVWTGADVARKRALVKDLVRLAADDSGRARCLFFIGDKPRHFLRTSNSKLTTWLDSETSRHTFEDTFGPVEDRTVSGFLEGLRKPVELVDLHEELPDVVGHLQPQA